MIETATRPARKQWNEDAIPYSERSMLPSRSWEQRGSCSSLALVMGAAVFNLLHTFLGGILMFSLLYWFARWATKTDPADSPPPAQFVEDPPPV